MKRRFIRMKRFGGVIILCSLVLAEAAMGHAELVDRIVAVVNDDAIALSELNAALLPYIEKIRMAQYPAQVESEMLFKVRQDVLNELIDQKLTAQETERQKVEISDKEVDQHIERIKIEYHLTDEELRDSLSAQGVTLEEYRERIKEQILRMKLITYEVKSKIAITDKDIENYYETHKEEYQGARKYHLRSIVTEVQESDSEEQKKAAAEKAEGIYRALISGTDFDEVVQDHSVEGPAVTNVDLGFFTLDELSTVFRETVRSMAEGDVSPVLETPRGYQILMVREIREIKGKTLKEASVEIHEKLYREFEEEKHKEWLKGLRERSYIKIIL